jgi:hypothetical protein
MFEALDSVVLAAPQVLPNHHVDWSDPEPPRQKVASEDITRTDAIGRSYVLVPAGQPPDGRVRLTGDEERSLVDPPPPTPEGTMRSGLGGFHLEGVVMGRWEE